MKTKVLSLIFLLVVLSSFSLPTYIDYGETKKGMGANTNEYFWETGLLAFNGAPEVNALCTYLKHTYDIAAAVETGTFRGDTTIFFSYLFDEVHTIEIVPDVHYASKEKLSKQPNIHCHLGSSDEVFKELLPTIRDKTVLFYLDAHWQNHWPLRNELIEISKTHYDNCIIVIDDCQVPDRKDIPFDQYEQNSCSYPYFKNQLDKIFSDYTIHFIIPKNPSCRAKFLAIPATFIAEREE